MGYWRLNDSAGTTATDSINARNGTYTGGFTLSQTGALVPYGDSDNAVLFNGSAGFVDFTSSPPGRTYSAWTLAAWIIRPPPGKRRLPTTQGSSPANTRFRAHPVLLSYGRNAGATGSQVSGGYWDGSGWENVIDPIEATLNTYSTSLHLNSSLLKLWRNFDS